MKSFLCVLSSLLLFGCAMAPTTGDTLDKDVTTNITNTEGLLLLYAPITNSSGYESASKIGGAILDQALEGKAALGYNGSTASLADEGAKQIFEGVSSLAEWWMNKEKEKPVVPAEKPPVEVIPNTPPPSVPVVVIPNEPPSKVPAEVAGRYETAEWYKVDKGNGRTIWYFKKAMKDYPKDFDVVLEGCGKIQVRGNDGSRQDFDEQFKRTTQNTSSLRTFISHTRYDPIKRPDKDQVMTMVGPSTCKTKVAYIPTYEKPTTYNPPQTYSMSSLEGNNKYYTWLGFRGKDKKGPVKFVFKDCGQTLIVEDPSNAYGANGNVDDQNQMYYWSGDPTKQDDTTGGDLASVFGPPNCKAKTVDVYLSK